MVLVCRLWACPVPTFLPVNKRSIRNWNGCHSRIWRRLWKWSWSWPGSGTNAPRRFFTQTHSPGRKSAMRPVIRSALFHSSVPELFEESPACALANHLHAPSRHAGLNRRIVHGLHVGRWHVVRTGVCGPKAHIEGRLGTFQVKIDKHSIVARLAVLQ